MVKTSVNGVLFPGNSPFEMFVNLPVASIEAAIADHFVMFFRDMLYEALYKFRDRNGFFHIQAVFMAVVVEGDEVPVVVVNPGSGDDRPPKITPDISDNAIRITIIGFGENIEAILVFTITTGFYFFKGRPNPVFQFIEESGTENFAEKGIVKMGNVTPKAVITVTAFGNKAVDVRVPFQIPSKGMKDHDKTGSKVHGFILLQNMRETTLLTA